MRAIRIVLAEDNAELRGHFRSLLEKAEDIEVVGEAGDGLQAIRLVEELDPDILLLDVEMPVMDGLAVIRQIRAADLPVKVLILSGHVNSHYVQCVLANGASGYITKDEVLNALLDAIRGIAQGEIGWISPRASLSLRKKLG